MSKNLGFNVENNFKKKLVTTILSRLVFAVSAEEPTPPDPNPTPAPTVNYEDLIAKARKEEKDKLYPKITALEKERNELIEKINAHLIKIGELQSVIDTNKAEIEALKSKKNGGDNEQITSLTNELTQAKKDLEDLKATIVDADALRAEIRTEVEAEYAVKNHREKLLASEEIVPELVTGDTIEALDASFAVSQTRYKELAEKFAKGTQTPPPNTPPARVPSVNPSIRLGVEKMTVEDLARMDVKSPEYAELRKQLGLK